MLFFGLENSDRTFVPTFKALNMLDGILFVVFLVFRDILTVNWISRKYLDAVYTVDTGREPCSLFLTAENVPSIFDAMIWTSKHQPYHFSIFQTSKYVRRHLVCCLFAYKCVFSFDFRYFNKQIVQLYLSCRSLACKYNKHSLLFVFNFWKCSTNLWFCSLALEKLRAPFFEPQNL